jgi:hypothetical protein
MSADNHRIVAKTGISIRKTIKAFVYDVFEDGYPIGQLRRD